MQDSREQAHGWCITVTGGVKEVDPVNTPVTCGPRSGVSRALSSSHAGFYPSQSARQRESVLHGHLRFHTQQS